MKVCTFNIRYDNPKDGYHQWSNRRPIVQDFLRYEAPDFIGLQEALKHQIEAIATAMPGYAWIGVGRDDGVDQGEFSPIFYQAERWKLLDNGTFWLSESPTSPSKSWDAALPRICTFGKFQDRASGEVVFVFNTHYDHKGTEARAQSSQVIVSQIRQISGGNKTVLMGDFNSLPEKPAIQEILEAQLKDAFTEALIRYGSVGTYNDFDLQKVPENRIDYIFYSADWQCTRYGVDSRVIEGRYLSDHFPVIVHLENP